jgi:hypothetical protein
MSGGQGMGEKKEPKLKRLAQLSSLHQQIFDVQIIRGVCFQRQFRVNDATGFLVNATWLPMELREMRTPQGSVFGYGVPTLFQTATTVKIPEVKLHVVLGDAKALTVTTKPVEALQLQMKLGTGQKTGLVPSFKAEISIPYVKMGVEIRFMHMTTMMARDFRISLGTGTKTLGLQYLLRKDALPSWAVLLHRQWSRTMACLSVIKDGDVGPCVTCRFRKTIRDGWSAGVSLSADNMMCSQMTVGWKGIIGKAIFHSSVNTEWEVKSHLRMSVSPTFDMIVTGSLDHRAHAYRFGLGFDWSDGK